MEKVKGRANRQVWADSPMIDEAEVEKCFWLSRPDGWVTNRKTKKIIVDKLTHLTLVVNAPHFRRRIFFLISRELVTVGSPTSRTCGGWQRSSTHPYHDRS
jgi:hypothetical protein